jgi:hypothetical protein
VLASDQHPDHHVQEGERFIASIYNAIKQNAGLWSTTALLIVYDEHGGIYDHVPPPACLPDGFVAQPKDTKTDLPFLFDRLGVRVPAILVSPWVPKGTVVSPLNAGKIDMAVIRVPKPPAAAFDKGRRPSSLLRSQIEHLEWATRSKFGGKLQPGFFQLEEGVRLQPSVLGGHLQTNYLVDFQQFLAGSDSKSSFHRWTVDRGAVLLSADARWLRYRREPLTEQLPGLSIPGTQADGGFPVVFLSFAWGGSEGHHFIGTIDSTLLGGSSRPSLH